jgi:hypothetical protein
MDAEYLRSKKKEYHRRYYERLQADPERAAAIKERKRQYRLATRDKCRARASAWKRANPEKIRAYKKADRQKNSESYRERSRIYYEENRDHLRAEQKRRWIKNHDRELTKSRERRAANPEKFRGRQKAYKLANPAAWRLYGTRKSAKTKGIACDLDKEWFEVRFAAGVCEMSGLPFDMKTKFGPNSPSVDRIAPKGPYTKANCRMILWWLNRAMLNLGEEYAIGVFSAVIARRDK